MTVGEAENPRRNIPRAIRLTFYRILVFYIVLILLLTMIIPYNSKQLMTATKQNTSAAASPFVAAIVVAGIHGLPGFLNACVLLFVFSAANSDLYIASRTLHGLALKGHAPRFLAKTDKRGVPIYALGLSTMFCSLAFLNVSTNSATVFGYFVNLVTIFGLLTVRCATSRHLLRPVLPTAQRVAVILTNNIVDLHPRDAYLLHPRPQSPESAFQRPALQGPIGYLWYLLRSLLLHPHRLHQKLQCLHERFLWQFRLQELYYWYVLISYFQLLLPFLVHGRNKWLVGTTLTYGKQAT